MAVDHPAARAELQTQRQGRGMVITAGGFGGQEFDNLQIGADRFRRSGRHPSGLAVGTGWFG